MRAGTWAGIWDNPVVTKEFRGRMRGPRAYWLLFGYLLLLSLTLFFTYLQWSESNAMQVSGGTAGFTIGRTFFLMLFSAQAILITLITPALTAGAISIEREQRTFEMLRATTLSPRAIALGKLASSVSFVVLLLTSSLPLVSLCFLLGGVSPGEVFFGYLLLVADAFLFGAMGLAWSSHAGGTPAATAFSYGSVFLWFFLTLPFAADALDGFSNGSSGQVLEAVNPLGAAFGAVQPERCYHFLLAGWIPALLLIVTLGVVLLLSCINRLEDDPARRAWPLRLATLIFCALLLFLGNGTILSFPFIAGFGVGQAGGDELLMLLTLALGAALVFVPPFVTGEAAWGATRRIWRGALPSGLPFALVLTGVIAVLLFVSLGMALSGRSNFVATTASPGWMPLVAQIWRGALWQAALLLAAVTVGLGGVGLLLSALVKSRWAALISLYGLIVLALTVPTLSYATLNGQDARSAWGNPAINTLYLSPWMGFSQISSTVLPSGYSASSGYGGTFASRYPVVQGMAGYGAVPFWVVTALLYAGIGIICYGIGRRRLIASARPTKTT